VRGGRTATLGLELDDETKKKAKQKPPGDLEKGAGAQVAKGGRTSRPGTTPHRVPPSRCPASHTCCG